MLYEVITLREVVEEAGHRALLLLQDEDPPVREDPADLRARILQVAEDPGPRRAGLEAGGEPALV